jgi:hypothetical protein
MKGELWPYPHKNHSKSHEISSPILLQPAEAEPACCYHDNSLAISTPTSTCFTTNGDLRLLLRLASTESILHDIAAFTIECSSIVGEM